jgi:uncharacterized membrane-anchored protein
MKSRALFFKLPRMFAGVLAALLVFSAAAPAQDGAPDGNDGGEPNVFEKNGITLVRGPSHVSLGRYAGIDIPENHAFIGGNSIKKYYSLIQNSYSGNELGVVLSSEGWEIHFTYADSGHIDDKDKSDLDANALYSSMEAGQKRGNEERRKKGWDALMLKGWTSKPHYDEKTNNLTWAYRLASSRDNYTETFINQNIRLLGRTGYVSAVVVGDDTADYAKTEAQANALLSGFRFAPGQTYAEFRSGDKIAQYGLAALVLGGAGAVAAKTGFLAKFAKFIILGVVAVGAWIARMFRKIIGAKNADRFGDDPNP